MKKKVFLGLLLTIGLVFSYNYIYQDHRNIETEKVKYKITSQYIKDEFKMDALKSEKKYLNKTIEVSGIVSELSKNNLTLDDHVFCVFTAPINNNLRINSKTKVKGRLIGYDDLLEQIKLDQCIIK
ncbi:hypothetical protein [uncultured Algibacter sp.]|uniref:OB-fold protein n=1 Tax=uncultured Algibacter sp. TaxID=298659 RepID=UPI00261E1555|nr:hypothetical protein [uncultured Algibacter sp.]